MASGVMLSIPVLLGFLMVSVDGACRFPAEVDRDDNRWRFMSPDYDVSKDTVHAWRKVTVDGERMHVDYMSESGEKTDHKTLTYHCMDQKDKDKFILMSQQPVGGVKFICVQFLSRGPDVIQWKASDWGPKRPGMCEDNKLHILDSPMVYYNEMGGLDLSGGQKETPKCPLEGGYVIRNYFTENSDQGCEEDTIPPLKLENGCEEGEGLYFLGGNSNCPSPHEKILIGRQYQCLGSWTEGKYTFMMVDQSQPNGLVPCLRYATNKRQRFTMHLFLDGVCDSGDSIQNSRIYRQMVMAMFPAKGICSDDTPACEVKDTAHCPFALAKSCRQSCQSCPADAPWTGLTFPEQFYGVWLKDSNHLGRENVTIDKHHIHIPSLGIYRTMGETDCSRKQPAQVPYGMTKEAKEYSLVQTFFNGCSHRMTVLQIVNRSDSVLSFRVSKPGVVDWKLAVNESSMKWEITEGWEKWCRKITYLLPQQTLTESSRTDLTGWFNLVLEGSDAPTVNCTLPEKILEEFTMMLPTGQECNGVIMQNEPDSVELSYKDCKSSGILQSGSHAIQQLAKFECLASFEGDSGRTFFITRTPKEFQNAVNESHICWVFSTGQSFGSVFWFRVSECDANSDLYVQGGFRQELAKFSFHFVPPPVEEVVIGSAESVYLRLPRLLLLLPFVVLILAVKRRATP